MPCSITETEDQVLIKAEEPIGRISENNRGLPAGLIEETSRSY
jgi:hypothetical protein